MNRTTRRLTLIAVWATILALGCIGGCGSSPMRISTSARVHGWMSLMQDNNERRGFGMYTYVLYGRIHSEPAMIVDERFQRLSKLLIAIRESTHAADEVAKVFAIAEINLFVIPETVQGTDRDVGYNFALAKNLLLRLSTIDGLEAGVSQRLRENAGPFLVSIHAPIADIRGQTVPLLFIDLSTTNQDAMKEVVAVYKQRIEARPVATVERFRPLRLALLELILNADDNLILVEEALANWSY